MRETNTVQSNDLSPMSNCKLDGDLAAIVQAIRDPNESIWDTSVDANGSIHVLFIADSAIPQANRMIGLGLAGGEGRSFTFQKIDGVWSINSSGRWVG